MAINIEKNDAAFSLQLQNFATKIGTYSTVLGLTAAEVTAIKADAAAFAYVLNNMILVQTFAQNYTSYKNMLRKNGSTTLGALPALPAFATAPPMPAANIEGRFRDLLQRITRSSAYTEAIGQDLGIEAAANKVTSANGKPEFHIELSSGGYPNLKWLKGGYDGIEIWKDAGGGFTKLDRDMRPDYIDKSTLPAAGTTALWKYKMIYLKNDEHVGSWSDVASITVYGEV